MNWVRVGYDSVRGRITTAWRRTADRFELDMSIPANTAATVYLPAKAASTVREGGRPLAKVRGVKLLREEAGQAVLEVESGRYRFESGL